MFKLPIAWAVIPAPMMTEQERAKKVQDAVLALQKQGYWVEIEGRVKNPIFDTGNEITTTKIKYRPCQNEDEASYVATLSEV